MSTEHASPTQQTVILLALCTSSLLTIQDQDLIPGLEAEVNAGVDQMMELIRLYPSENKEDFRHTEEIMRRVTKMINKPNSWFSVETVIFLGHQICTDLLGELCNREKRELITGAFQIFKRFDDFLDPDGDNEEVFNEVDEILEGVYKEIGFVKDLRYFKRHKKLQRKAEKNGRSAR